MLRAYVKNSFLTLEGPEETILRREAASASGRARSVGPPDDEPASAMLTEHQEMALHRLNILLESGPSTVQELLVGQPIQQQQQPAVTAEQEAIPRQEAAARDAAGTLATGSAGSSTLEKPGEGAPTVGELRRLQRRLSELAGATAKLSCGKRPLAQQRVLSNSSVSTMVSECEDGLVKSPMQKVWSSGSVSTMVSDIWEDHEEGGTEFGPIFEEDVAASSSSDALGSREEPHGQGLDSATAAGSSEAAPTQRLMQRDFCHPKVPKSLNLAEEFSKSSNEGPPTTMMIRNIPNRYTQRELIRELETLGFTGTFDFLYLPIDKGTMCNVGYAFVNFTDHSWAQRCMQVFENYHFKKNRKARGKIATVSVAHIQGLEANVRHYENSAVTGGAMSRFRQRGPVIMASLENSLQ